MTRYKPLTFAAYETVREAIERAIFPGICRYVVRGTFTGDGRSWVEEPAAACVIAQLGVLHGIGLPDLMTWDEPVSFTDPTTGEVSGGIPRVVALIATGRPGVEILTEYDPVMLWDLQRQWDRNVTSTGGWGTGRSVSDANRAGMRDVLRHVERIA